MSDSEFDVIDQYFKSDFLRDDVSVGIGDDCALLDVPQNKQLVTTTDTLISGVHFPAETNPEDIASKVLAVNLSDLAAMGAQPTWITLALTIPAVDHQWLEAFSISFHRELKQYNVQLIGGDTTKGPLSITVQAMGTVDKNKSMLRSNAKSADLIYVSGCLGDAALGLMLHQKKTTSINASYFIGRLNRPDARVELGQALTEYCNCAIDISDGLFADLGHILESSGCGAEVILNKIPVSTQMQNYLANEDTKVGIHKLMRGDDYELCFTVSKDKGADIQKLGEQLNIPLTCIGIITEGEGMTFINNGKVVYVKSSGFNHFTG